jgi:gluconokinase
MGERHTGTTRAARPIPRGKVVVMGVAGCGKSSVAKRCARALGWSMVEGDRFHSPQSTEKMRHGVPLTDADRQGWLERLRELLRTHPDGLFLACSALRRSYRDVLRESDPALRFVFLDIDAATARQRVAARRGHIFPDSLVASQFDTLERPDAEPGVLTVDGTQPPSQLVDAIVQWLAFTLA